MSFAVAAIILASLSPLVLFLLVNTPPLSPNGRGGDVTLVALVAAIAFAGVVANARLLALMNMPAAAARWRRGRCSPQSRARSVLAE